MASHSLLITRCRPTIACWCGPADRCRERKRGESERRRIFGRRSFNSCPASRLRCSVSPLLLSRHLIPGEEQPGLDDRVGIERDALDALLEQPAREVRVIRRALAADADVLALLATRVDGHLQQRLHRLVAL